MDLSFIGTHAITRNLDHRELERVAERMIDVERIVGDHLTVQGEPIEGLFLLSSGKVRVSMHIDEQHRDQTITFAEAPTVIGEMELVAYRSCLCTTTVVEPVVGYLLQRDTFEEMVGTGDSAVEKIVLNSARTVVNRVAESNLRLVEMIDPQHKVQSISDVFAAMALPGPE